MASIEDNSGNLKTQVYIIFNRKLEDKAVHGCRQHWHLETVFNMLRQVPYKKPATDGSPTIITGSLKIDFIEICKEIHNYSFDIFADRVTKHKDKLLEIRGYIEQDQTRFEPEDHSKLVEFFQHVDGIIMAVDKVRAEKELPAICIQLILSIYSHWTKHNILPKDLAANNEFTLLDHVDTWLARSAWSDS
jgi:hypothetical protein